MKPQIDEFLKRVAVCTAGELFGGVERHVLEMASTVRAQGVSTLLILFHNGELAAQARERGIESLILSDSNLSVLATSRRLADILNRENIRIVHAHGYKATVFCAMARRRCRFALIKTAHGLPEKLAGRPVASMRGRLYHLLDRAATRLSRATVCYVTEELLTRYGRGKRTEKVHVIPNGIAPIDRTGLKRPAEFLPGHFNLVTVGRLEPVKALHLAIDAFSATNMPPNVHLYILGTGPCEKELIMRSQARGVAERVHFLGFRRDAYNFIAHCDATLIPSLHEGLPYVLLEAMALGAPVIASRVGGIVEVIEDDVSGLLVPPNDAAALANAILRLIGEPPLRARLGWEAQRLQRKKYSLQAMANSYLNVYREVLPRQC